MCLGYVLSFILVYTYACMYVFILFVILNLFVAVSLNYLVQYLIKFAAIAWWDNDLL